MTSLGVSHFAGADAWALYADVEMTPTHGSAAQISHLMSGDFDVASTAMDNLIA
jgi:hypothetical protein